MNSDVETLPVTRGTAKKFAHSQWPKREPGSRLMGGCDPYHAPKFAFGRDDSFFTVGSCFARNIEEYMSRAGVRVRSLDLKFPREELRPTSRPNDLLVKYTPGSIHYEIGTAFGDIPPQPDERYLVVGDEHGGRQDINMPTSFPAVTLERGVERRGQVRELFRSIAESDVFILTLGLIEHWYDNELGICVNSTPTARVEKHNPGRFSFRRLNFDENRRLVEQTVGMVHAANKETRIVVTTSPVPLGRTYTEEDVIVANGYSKSMLRVIAQEMALKHSFVDYFPSYEMVTLSPPEAAWDNDLRHVRDPMVGKVMAKFFDHYFEGDAAAAAGDVTRRFLAAKALLQAGDGRGAYAAFKTMEEQFPQDRVFWLDYTLSAIESKDGPGAARLAQILSERFPGAWADILQGRAAALQGDFDAALKALRRAKLNSRTALHASGWEMQIGKAAGDKGALVSGALGAADAILSGETRADKKPWITKLMLKTLEAEGFRGKLEALAPFLQKEPEAQSA